MLARLSTALILCAATATADDISVRMAHIQGFDKGYGAGDRWTVEDLERRVPPLIDTLSRAGFTTLFLNFEAGWINEAGQLLDTDVEALLKRIVEYGRKRNVGILIAIEYAGMEDRAASDAAFRKVRLWQVSGDESRRLVSSIRKTLCAIHDRDYYLKAVRIALKARPQAVAVSFDDFPAMNFEACRETYGVRDVRYSGKAIGKIATDVDEVRKEVSPATSVYVLPRFYGPPHWKSHPQALPDLLGASPANVHVIVTGDPDNAYLAGLKHPGRFAFWLNLTSNHMKDGKVWFPVEELQSAQPVDKLRGRPDSKVVLNFGSPPEAQQTAIAMSGAWLRGRGNFDAVQAIPSGVRRYGQLVSWTLIRESLGWNVLAHLKRPAQLAEQIATWRAYRKRAEEAVQVAREMERGSSDPWLTLNAERIALDYRVAVAIGEGKQDEVRAALKELGEFIQRYPVIRNDVKNAEVVARGFRYFQDYVDRPEETLRRLRVPSDER